MQEVISDRTLLVLYLTGVRHPYLFTSLRQLCKALDGDDELEIEFIKSRAVKFNVDFKKKEIVENFDKYLVRFLCNRLLKYMDDLGCRLPLLVDSGAVDFEFNKFRCSISWVFTNN